MSYTARVWKDPVLRAALDEDELALLPTHPVGVVELPDVVMDATRGADSSSTATIGCCGTAPITFRTCFTCNHIPNWTCYTCWTCEC
ncbi:mersacidin/lichenicidin family type 2 lantibiotic [Dactylosporangium sp. CA-233914]|uniref:mersacidin/lichenicidin family type 2 lantibiotic n=1 Tax=Dactylosporangium sp. CA-233914 TaxID=3239934 RepID=UPI003D92ACF0